jgi:Clathrin adaptor complex small chain
LHFSSFVFSAQPLLPLIKCILILDEDGGRVSAKYYNKAEFPDHASQTDFEAKLWKKTKNVNARVEADIVLLDERVAVFRSGADVHLYVVGASDENELILAAVLDALHDAISALLRGQVSRCTLRLVNPYTIIICRYLTGAQ